MTMRMSIIISLCAVVFSACSVGNSETWEIDNLKEIGGHDVTVFGDPEVVETEIGRAVIFDGEDDMLLVDFNPIGEAKAFTVEVLFKQNASFPEKFSELKKASS